MSEDICACVCVSELICHYFGGALFILTSYLFLQTTGVNILYNIKTSKRNQENNKTFFKKKK